MYICIIQVIISHLRFYDEVSYTANKNSIRHLKLSNLLGKGYDLVNIADSFRQTFFANNIDNLLIKLVGPTTK